MKPPAKKRTSGAKTGDVQGSASELDDPSGLFNASLDGNVRRAIDIHEGDEINAGAFKALVRAALALNMSAHARDAELIRISL